MNHSIKFLALLCLLSVIVAGCASSPVAVVPSNAPAPTAAAGVYWPTAGWRTSTPKEQGMDSPMLADTLATIQARQLNIHSFLIIRHGYLVSETYFKDYQPDTRQALYSCTKSFVSTDFCDPGI